MDKQPAPGMLFLCNVLLLTTETCRSFMRETGLLKADKICDCGTMMTTNKRKDITDGEVWNCNNCLKRTSIRTGSFFEVL